jgi:hypothetical protein
MGDGTGPFGLGSRKGRRRGRCSSGLQFGDIKRGTFRGKNRWLLGLAAPFIVAVIRDFADPKGLLRQLVVVFFRERRMIDPQNISGDAEYSVIDEKAAKSNRKANI